MKVFSKRAYTTDTVTKTVIICMSVCAAAALAVALLAVSFPKKTEEQKQFESLKEELFANVTLPKEDWYYSYSMSDFDNSETVELFLTTDEHFKSADFYIMLCTIKNIEEYLKTRDDCKNKSLKIGFEEWRAGKVWSFDMTFGTDGRAVFYYDWTYNADLTKLAEVFPNTNEVEFSYQYSDYGESHIEELSGLSKLEKLKFTFDVNKADEREAHIRDVFPNCVLDIKRSGYLPTEEQKNHIKEVLPDCNIDIECIGIYG